MISLQVRELQRRGVIQKLSGVISLPSTPGSVAENFASPDADSRGWLAHCVGVRREPHVRKELDELSRGVGRGSTQNITEVGKRVDVLVPATAGQEVYRTAAVRPQGHSLRMSNRRVQQPGYPAASRRGYCRCSAPRSQGSNRAPPGSIARRRSPDISGSWTARGGPAQSANPRGSRVTERNPVAARRVCPRPRAPRRRFRPDGGDGCAPTRPATAPTRTPRFEALPADVNLACDLFYIGRGAHPVVTGEPIGLERTTSHLQEPLRTVKRMARRVVVLHPGVANISSRGTTRLE